MAALGFEYRSTDISEIDLVRPLWIQLNEHHHAKARAFRKLYEDWRFDDRKEYFRKVASTGLLRIDLAADRGTGRYIGYCISSISPEKNGEIESIYVEGPCRSQGVGAALVTRALAWLDENGSKQNRVSVADGNEDAFSFYGEFGFYPRMTVLEQKKS